MPPAPTTPRTVDARTLNSHQNSPIDSRLGATSGTKVKASTLTRAAPVAAAASSGPGGMFSIASAHSFAVLPHVCRAMPRTPAKGPRPTAATKRSAKTNESTPHARHLFFLEAPDQDPRVLDHAIVVVG